MPLGKYVVDKFYDNRNGSVTLQVNKGDRIAQLVCERICTPTLVSCETLDETDRGANGFGSTGTN